MAVHGLPVGPLPEQFHVAAMWDDVVNAISDAATTAGTVAVLGQREECLALSAPLGIVAAFGGVRPALVGFRFPAKLARAHDAMRNTLPTTTDARS